MAWDIERTKTLLLEAATEEFCTFGLAGARVDRIATRAGVNKERIYQYFGRKNDFFGIVITRALTQVADDVPFRGTGPEAFGDYVGRIFDHHLADSTVPRLLFWEGLELGAEAGITAERAEHHAMKISKVQAMLPGIDTARAAELLQTAITLIDAWCVIPQFDQLTTGRIGTAATPERSAARRAEIVRLVVLDATAAVGAVV